jgi:hypothetical protein
LGEFAVRGLLRGILGVSCDEVGEAGVVVRAERMVEGKRVLPAAAEEIPVAVAGEIDGDAVEPGGQRGVTAEFRETAMSAEEGVLDDFLGVGVIMKQVHHRREDLGLIAFHDGEKGGIITGIKTTHQFRIYGGFSGALR